MVKKLFLFALVMFSALLMGCGEPLPEGMPRLIPCELTLLQEGKPLVGATVSLLPEKDQARWNLVGITNESGTANILANGKYKGVPEGKYKIIIIKVETEAGTGPAIPQAGEPGYDEAVANLDKRPPAKRFTLVEDKYSNPKDTPLAIDIPARGSVRQNIEAGKAVRISK
ncbi:MAG: hypothetical protein Q4G69_08895 [Planctomycetia bacterium]|nr:hypothetical protein [Planctomycetia bacterium]